MRGAVSFGVLGPVQVTVDGQDATPTRTRLRELLALLLVRPGRAVRSSTLIAELYGSHPPETATTALQVHVSQLRKALRAAGDPSRRLHTEPGAYRFEVDRDELDLHRFERLAAMGERLLEAGATGRAARVLRDALDVWRGPALTDVTSPSLVEVHAPRAEERRLAVLELRIEADLADGADARVVPELRNLVTEHPLREKLRSHLVVALYRDGRQADALAELAGYRAVLASELGVRPGPDLVRLQNRILHADPSLRGPRPEPVRAGSRAVVPAQLPPSPDLVGRDAASVALLAAFDDPAPLALATGGAGTGTTALVLSVAHRVRHRFPGGQLFARAAGSDPGEVFGSFLQALGTPPAAVPQGTAARAGLLTWELAGRRVLVVLDDVPAGWGAAALARHPEGSALLMSSTALLPELGERARRVPIGRLDRADALAMLTAVLGEQRVAAEPGPAGDIVERCGRLPLALRTVAARTAGRPHLPLRAVAARLASPSGLLTELVAGDLCVRESLLRRYEACDESQQRAFRLLAGVEAATADGAVAGGRREAVAALAETGLLDVVEVAAGASGYQLSTVCSALAAELWGAGPQAGSGSQRIGGHRTRHERPGGRGGVIGGCGAAGHVVSS